MYPGTATAISCPNIALIKYWGNRDDLLRIPSNGSISMNLEGLTSRTQVTFNAALPADRLALNGQAIHGNGLLRASGLLERVRRLAGIRSFAEVQSENNFPTGAGIASSASGFAALTLAACAAAGLELAEPDLSRLARTASGSACRSIPAGFVEWQAGEDDQSSFAFTIAPPGHWDLVDCIAIVSRSHKANVSQEGHALAASSPLQAARISGASHRLDLCRAAILQRDFEALAQVVELDSHLMHAVIMTTQPPLFYWHPATVAVMQAVLDWRKSGVPVCYTIDAGPNVHVLCPAPLAAQLREDLRQIPGVFDVLIAHPGGPARLVSG
jgi:diphosphomevalonate decarboxylase